VKNTVDLALVLSFLKQLQKNKGRAWFEAQRADCENALGRFEDFVAALIIKISSFADLARVMPKDCMFRTYRDARFARDKSPVQEEHRYVDRPRRTQVEGIPQARHRRPSSSNRSRYTGAPRGFEARSFLSRRRPALRPQGQRPREGRCSPSAGGFREKRPRAYGARIVQNRGAIQPRSPARSSAPLLCRA